MESTTTGAKFGIMGDDFGTDIPEMKVPEQDLTVEKNMARFSKSEEFKKLKQHFEERIEFYQKNLPNGAPIGSTMPTGADWVVANTVIAEFRAVLAIYEQAREAVENAVHGKGA